MQAHPIGKAWVGGCGPCLAARLIHPTHLAGEGGAGKAGVPFASSSSSSSSSSSQSDAGGAQRGGGSGAPRRTWREGGKGDGLVGRAGRGGGWEGVGKAQAAGKVCCGPGRTAARMASSALRGGSTTQHHCVGGCLLHGTARREQTERGMCNDCWHKRAEFAPDCGRPVRNGGPECVSHQVNGQPGGGGGGGWGAARVHGRRVGRRLGGGLCGGPCPRQAHAGRPGRLRAPLERRSPANGRKTARQAAGAWGLRRAPAPPNGAVQVLCTRTRSWWPHTSLISYCN